ncbi:MAG: helix-turn-helix transcriptional regulator [Hydrogenophaga sp.]|uniref:helix-turn-helix transcriptional regulator n=1 Tax=Hydrogenophaga sp. TaxID=1904254 RepID=UPI004035148E
MELKTWVKNAREHAGMTIEQLGSAVGRSKAAAGFWETGKTKPSYAQVQKISLVTGWPMPEGAPPAEISDLAKARGRRWPFSRIDQQKFLALLGADARNMENAILAAAGDLNIDIRPTRSGKIANG